MGLENDFLVPIPHSLLPTPQSLFASSLFTSKGASSGHHLIRISSLASPLRVSAMTTECRISGAENPRYCSGLFDRNRAGVGQFRVECSRRALPGVGGWPEFPRKRWASY